MNTNRPVIELFVPIIYLDTTRVVRIAFIISFSNRSWINFNQIHPKIAKIGTALIVT